MVVKMHQALHQRSLQGCFTRNGDRNSWSLSQMKVTKLLLLYIFCCSGHFSMWKCIFLGSTKGDNSPCLSSAIFSLCLSILHKRFRPHSVSDDIFLGISLMHYMHRELKNVMYLVLLYNLSKILFFFFFSIRECDVTWMNNEFWQWSGTYCRSLFIV